MSKGDRGFFSAIGLVALIATIIGFATWPIQPQLERYRYERPDAEGYHPGGSQCEPKALAAIGDRAGRLSAADACAEKAENYRHDRDDLVQQTRAADGAAAQVVIARQVLWMGWFQTIGGFITLAAAIAAAIYARDAAKEGKRSADVARDGQRPWLSLKIAVPKGLTFHPEFVHIKLIMTVKNVGLSAAHNIRISPNFVLRSHPQELPPYFSDHLAQALTEEVTGLMLVPGEEVEREGGMKIFRRDFGGGFEGKTHIFPMIAVSVTYQPLESLEIHQTARMYLVTEKREEGDRAILVEDGDVPADRVKLTDRGGGRAT